MNQRATIAFSAFALTLTVALPAQGLSRVRSAEALVTDLVDAERRAAATERLIEMGAEAAPALVGFLVEAPEELARAEAIPALEVLAKLRGKAAVAVPALVELRAHAPRAWRGRLDATLVHTWPYTADFWGEQDFTGEYRAAYEERGPFRREILDGIHRLRRVYDTGADPRDAERLLRFLVDDDAELRRMSADALRLAPEVVRARLPELADAVRFPLPMAATDRRFQECRELADLIVEVGGENAESVEAHVYLMLYGETEEVRLQGVAGLAGLGEHAGRAYRYTHRAFEHDVSHRVRVAIVKSWGNLGHQGDDAAVLLQHLSGHPHREIREAATTSLAKLRAVKR